MSNRDEFFLDINGSPKYIRIDELISEIYRKIKNNLNENCILDVFFANCSPPIMHEKTQRLQRVETEDEINCIVSYMANPAEILPPGELI